MRAPRALGVAAREAKQRMPGLRVVAVLVGLAEGLLGLGEVAEPQARLAELVEGRAGDPRTPGPQFLPGLARQFLGLVEAAPEAHDLGVVHAAHPGERGHGVRVAELGGAVRPLRSAVEIGHLAARTDRVAVDDERRIRVELAPERGRARLVEQHLALGDLALLEERRALALDAADLEAPVREALADLLGRLSLAKRFVVVVLAECDERPLQRPVAVLGSLFGLVEMPLGPRKPAARHRGLELGAVVVGEDRGDIGGAGQIAGFDIALVRALGRVHVLGEEAAPEGRLGEELEVLRRELVRGVGLLQKGVGGVPVAPTNRVAACFKGGFEDLAHARRLSQDATNFRRPQRDCPRIEPA